MWRLSLRVTGVVLHVDDAKRLVPFLLHDGCCAVVVCCSRLALGLVLGKGYVCSTRNVVVIVNPTSFFVR